jgi:hypothetical protein
MPSFLLGFDGELFAEVNGKPIREGDKASKNISIGLAFYVRKKHCQQESQNVLVFQASVLPKNILQKHLPWSINNGKALHFWKKRLDKEFLPMLHLSH